MPRKWEYKVLKLLYDDFNIYTDSTKIESELNALGDEGWELVTAVYDDVMEMPFVVFKREKA